jgi:integrase
MEGCLMAGQRRTKGGGGISRRADGRWVASVDFGKIGGKRVRPQKTCRTKADAVREVRRMLRSQDRGVIPDTVTTRAWLAHWLDHAELRPRTRQTYAGFIRTWIDPQLGGVQILKLAPEHLKALRRTMEAKGRTPATIRHVHMILRAALATALEEGRVERNVAAIVKAPAARSTPHRTLTAESALDVLASASGRDRVRAIVAFLGLRQGEALGLRRQDVQELAGVLCLVVGSQVQWIKGERTRGPLKSAASQRIVPVPPPWDAELRGYLMMLGGSDAEPLFGEVSPYVDSRRWAAMLDAAGVDRIPLHGARGTGASVMLALGIPERYIADILGHAAVRVTQEHYLHSDATQRLAAVSSLAGWLEAVPD